MTKEYIIETCKKYNIENYTINDDLSIDVNGDVDLSNEGLTEVPLIFNIVSGFFDCTYNNLTSLKGVPGKCGYFSCSNNNLTNLEGAPDECEFFSCCGNKLTTLKGAPRCDYISADYNKLNLDNEDLYIIEVLCNKYNNNYKEIKDYLEIRRRDELINLILD